jgi:hypothetical protein
MKRSGYGREFFFGNERDWGQDELKVLRLSHDLPLLLRHRLSGSLQSWGGAGRSFHRAWSIEKYE